MQKLWNLQVRKENDEQKCLRTIATLKKKEVQEKSSTSVVLTWLREYQIFKVMCVCCYELGLVFAYVIENYSSYF